MPARRSAGASAEAEAVAPLTDHAIVVRGNVVTLNAMFCAYSVQPTPVQFGKFRVNTEKSNPFWMNETPDEYIARCVKVIQKLLPHLKAGRVVHLQEVSDMFLGLLSAAVEQNGLVSCNVVVGPDAISKGSVKIINSQWAQRGVMPEGEMCQAILTQKLATAHPRSTVSMSQEFSEAVRALFETNLKDKLVTMLEPKKAKSLSRFRLSARRVLCSVDNNNVLYLNVHFPVGWYKDKRGSVDMAAVIDAVRKDMLSQLQSDPNCIIKVTNMVIAGDFNATVAPVMTTYGRSHSDWISHDTEAKCSVKFLCQPKPEGESSYVYAKDIKVITADGNEIKVRPLLAATDSHDAFRRQMKKSSQQDQSTALAKADGLWSTVFQLFADYNQQKAADLGVTSQGDYDLAATRVAIVTAIHQLEPGSSTEIAGDFVVHCFPTPESTATSQAHDQQLLIEPEHIFKGFSIQGPGFIANGRFVLTYGRPTVLFDEVKSSRSQLQAGALKTAGVAATSGQAGQDDPLTLRCAAPKP